MPSNREKALQGLFAIVRTAVPAGTIVRRNDTGNNAGKPGAYVDIRDGDMGDPEVGLSPERYFWRHEAEIFIGVEGNTGPTRANLRDDMIVAIDAAVVADRTLGDQVQYAETGTPRVEDVAPPEGGAGIAAAVLPVILEYESATMAG